MSNDTHATTGAVGRMIGEPARRVRDALAAMEARGVEVPRCGHYRFIPLALLPEIRAEVARMKRFVMVAPQTAIETQAAS